MHSIAIFGGTFDPIHNGHLQTSATIQARFNFDSYIFLPCKTPTIKPEATAKNNQRVEMIKLAIKNHPEFKLDLREMERNSPSFMVETLYSFRKEYPNSSITLIIGYDAFLSLSHWHQWEKLIILSNLLVINREEFAHIPLPEIMNQFLEQHQKEQQKSIVNTLSGGIELFDAGLYKISSTLLRKKIKEGVDIKDQLPLSVLRYIKHQGLYQ